MTCGIDEILEQSSQTIEDTIRGLIQELDADFDLNLNHATLWNTPEVEKLKGELGTFAVWLARGRHQQERP